MESNNYEWFITQTVESMLPTWHDKNICLAMKVKMEWTDHGYDETDNKVRKTRTFRKEVLLVFHRPMNYTKLIILIFVFILAVSFASENIQSVTLRYYFNLETPSFPMYLLMFIPLFIGIVVGSLVGLGSRLRLRNNVKKLKKSNRELENRLKEAQEAPIPEEYETTIPDEEPTGKEETSTT